MNKIKRIGAFLLTLVICLQAITFTVFAENNLDLNISGEEFGEYIKTPTMETINTDDFNIVNTENNQTSYAVKNDDKGVILRYSVDNDTKNVIWIVVAASLEKLETEEDIANFFALTLLTCSIVDDEIDIDVLWEALDFENPMTKFKKYFNHDIEYRKFINDELISFFIMPASDETQQSQTQQVKSQNNEISVVIDGKKLVSDVATQNINGRTMVPVRGIFEALGATVTWNPETKQVIATKADKKVTLTLNSATAYINGEAKTLESPAISYNGSTLVPARFVAEAFDATVTWDNATKTVNIKSVQ